MKENIKFIIGRVSPVLLLVSLALAGCSTTAGVETTGKSSWDEQGTRTFEKNIVFNNSSLKRAIQIVDVKTVMAADILRVQATLRSNERETLSLQYRFDWFDASGIEINSGGGSWKPLILYGMENKSIQSVAPDPRAKEFILKIRDVD